MDHLAGVALCVNSSLGLANPTTPSCARPSGSDSTPAAGTLYYGACMFPPEESDLTTFCPSSVTIVVNYWTAWFSHHRSVSATCDRRAIHAERYGQETSAAGRLYRMSTGPPRRGCGTTAPPTPPYPPTTRRRELTMGDPSQHRAPRQVHRLDRTFDRRHLLLRSVRGSGAPPIPWSTRESRTRRTTAQDPQVSL